MARPLNDEIQDLIAQNLVEEVPGNTFSGSVRNMDQDPLDVNDEFVIPKDYKVVRTAITPGGKLQEFTLVTVTNSVTGVTRNIRFFPNQLAKTIYPIVDGKRGNKVKTKGNVAEEYQRYVEKGPGGIDEAMKAFAESGKKIRITEKVSYETNAYQSSDIVSTNIFKYEWA